MIPDELLEKFDAVLNEIGKTVGWHGLLGLLYATLHRCRYHLKVTSVDYDRAESAIKAKDARIAELEAQLAGKGE